MRITRALLTCLLSAVTVSACADGGGPTETPSTEFGVSGASTAVATTKGRPVTPFTLASVRNGSGSYTYSASGLPSGLSIDIASGTVSGTPTSVFPSSPISVTVTDNRSNASKSVMGPTVTVNDVPQSTPNPAAAEVTVSQGSNVASFNVMNVTGGTPPFIYTITPSLPAGMTLNASTGAISGSPTGAVPPTTFQVVATDAAGAVTQASFSLTVSAGMTTTLAIPNQLCSVGLQCTFTPVTQSGGVNPVTFSIPAILPQGLSLNASTGAISGVPTSAQAATTYRMQVKDAAQAESFKDFQITINNTPLTATVVIPFKVCSPNVACSFKPVTATGGTAPLTFTSTSLPAGLSMSPSGDVSGTPTASQNDATVTVTVTDAAGLKVSKDFVIRVDAALTTVLTTPTKVCTQSAPCYAKPVTVSGGTAPYTFSVSPALPTGLSLDTRSGEISGPSMASLPVATPFTISVSDANGATGTSRQFTLTVNTVLTTTLAAPTYTCTSGANCAFTAVTPSGGTTPHAYALSGGSLPAGLQFNTSNGSISGVPSVALPLTTFTITVTDGAEDAPQITSSKSFAFSVSGSLKATLVLPVVTVPNGVSISTVYAGGARPVQGAGGTGTLTYLISPSLPSGLEWNAQTGTITGTPTSVTSTPHKVTVVDQAGATDEESFTLTIGGSLIVSTNVAIKVCTVGVACAFTPASASGGTLPYTFSVAPALPAGLSFNTSTGAITGTATASSAGVVYTVTVRDATNASGTSQFTLTVNPALATTLAVADVNCGELNGCSPSLPVTPVTAAGGTAPYTYSLTGTLPAGITLNTTTGALTGSATAALTAASVTITVTDAANAQSSKSFNISSLGSTQSVAAVACTVNTACSATPVTVNGGKAPYTFALTQGSLPTPMTINTSTGVVSGTVAALQSALPYEITITDGAGRTTKKSFTISVVTSAPLSTSLVVSSISCGDLNGCTSTIPVTPVSATGGAPPLTYALTGGTLPASLSFSTTTGVISGTVPTTGLAQTTFTVTVTDGVSTPSSKSFTFSSLTSTQAQSTLSCTLGSACSGTPVTITGGRAPYTYAITQGTLPSPMSINTSTGAISGTPTVAQGLLPYEITVTDGAGRTTKKSFSVSVTPLPISTTLVIPAIACGDVNGCTHNLPITPVTASGGAPPLTYTLTGGTLPTGWSFSTTTGAISGSNPTTGLAQTTFTVTVTDGVSTPSAKSFTLNTLASSLSSSALSCTLNTGCNLTPVTPVGGKAPFSYAVTNGTLPNSMSINTSTGAITGTPSLVQGALSYQITITDGSGAITRKSFTLSVIPGSGISTTLAVPAIACGDLNGCSVSIPFTPVTATGGTGIYTYALSGGTLPSGLSFSTSTGAVSGSAPSSALSQTTFTVTVNDGVSPSSAKSFTLSSLGSTLSVSAGSCALSTSCSLTPVTVNGGTSPFSFALTSGTLPSGMTINSSTGAISGTPTNAQSALSYQITVTDGAGATTRKSFTLSVVAPSVITTTLAVPAVACGDLNGCSVSIPFTPVTATGGTGNFTYALSGGTLPSGLSFSTSTGAISGSAPSSALGQTTFTVTVNDGVSPSSSKSFTLSSLGSTQAVPTGSCAISSACSITPVTVNGGTAPYSFALTSGTLPSPMTINSSTGVISGTPTNSQSAQPYEITITDGAGRTTKKSFTISVVAAGAITTTQAIADVACGELNGCNSGIPFTPVTASGGAPPYTYTLSGGSLPAGLSFSSSTGAISGAPTSALSLTTFTVTVTDGVNPSSAKTFTLSSLASNSTNVSCAANSGCSVTPVTPAGGRAPYSYSLTSGSLPFPLGLNASTGVISGSVGGAQSAQSYEITVTDAAGRTTKETFTLGIVAGLLNTTTVITGVACGELNGCTSGSPFTPVVATGGSSPYTFAISGGTLPSGMTFNTSNGSISGTPTSPLSYTAFTVTVTDGVSTPSSKTFNLSALFSTFQSDVTCQVGVSCGSTIPVVAAGGRPAPNFSYSISPSLPSGLSINSTTGAISGTPASGTATAGTTYQVTVQDANLRQSRKSFVLRINP